MPSLTLYHLTIFFLLLLLLSVHLPSVSSSDTSPSCPNDCSKHGLCQPNGLCRCEPLYLDWDCSILSPMSPITLGDPPSFTFYYHLLPPSTLLARITASTHLDHLIPSPENGWAALMFGASHGMIDGRLVRVGFDSTTSTPLAENMYSAGFRRPNATASTTFNVTGFVTDEGLDVSFASLVEPLLPPTMSVASTIPVSWAWGDVFEPMSKHKEGRHGMLRLDLTHNAVVHSQSLDFYTPVWVSLIIACALGLLMQVRPVKYSGLGQCCLHRRLPSALSCCSLRKWRRGAVRIPSEEKEDHLITPSKTASLLSWCGWYVRLLSFDVLHTVMGWSLGEWTLMALYFSTLAAFTVLGVKSFTDFVLEPKLLLGHLTSVHLALTLLPVTRQSLFLLIFAMPYERAVAYHRYCSRVTFACMALHGWTMWLDYGTDSLWKTDSLPHGDGAVWGTLTFLTTLTIVITSLSYVRRYLYELFYYVHLALFLPAVTFAAKHSTYFRFMLILPLLLVVVDWVRGMRRTYNGVEVRRVRLVQGGVDRVLLISAKVRGLREYRLGGYVQVNAPAISQWQWHAYSVCGLRRDAEGTEVDVCILDCGPQTWSGQLCAAVQSMQKDDGVPQDREERPRTAPEAKHEAEDTTDEDLDEDASPHPSVQSQASVRSLSPHAILVTPSASSALMEFSVYGPCGQLSFDVTQYHTLVLVAGGVGITPCIEVMRWVMSARSSVRVYLIWASRNGTFLTHLFPDTLKRMKRSTRCHLLLFDTARQAKEGRVASKRMVKLGEGEAGGEGGMTSGWRYLMGGPTCRGCSIGWRGSIKGLGMRGGGRGEGGMSRWSFRLRRWGWRVRMRMT